VSDTHSDSASALFLLTGALRGRAAEGPPPPRVLDVLVFARAQVRFRAVSAAAAGAGGDLPWRVPDAGAALMEPGPGDTIFVHGETQPAPPTEARVASASSEERPAAAKVVASPTVATGERVEAAPPLRFRVAVVPAAAPPAPEPSAQAEPERERGETIADAPSARPDEARSPEPVVFGAPPPGALPFAARPAAPPTVVSTEALTPLHDVTRPTASAAEPLPRREPVPAAASQMDLPAAVPELPWADPLRLEPPVPARERSASSGGAAWRFAPSPARSAAETAVRVARAETGVSEEAVPTDARHDVPEPPQLRSADEPPLTTAGLLREVTRDEVVRALAERMRVLARDDRFRLGELR
jgi:hypothetical protein